MRENVKKDLMSHLYIDCDDVNDLTFQHNVMCWANKVMARDYLQKRVTKYVQGTIQWGIRGTSCCTHVKTQKCKNSQEREYWMWMSHYGNGVV